MQNKTVNIGRVLRNTIEFLNNEFQYEMLI